MDEEKIVEDSVEMIEEKKEQSEFVESLIQSLNAMIENAGDKDISEEQLFTTLLGMPDEQFSIIAPIFIEEITKTFSSSQAQLVIAQALNANGLKYEDIIILYQEMIEKIDKEVNNEIISPVKKEFIKELFMTILNSMSEAQLIAKRVIQIPIELMNENAKIPSYANVTDAGADLYATENYTIKPGEQAIVKTGIKVAIPYGYAILIQPRSGLSAKTKLRICNTPGLIDSGYRGEICVLVENVDSPIKDVSYDPELGIIPLYGNTYTIEKGDRIAQMRLVEAPSISFSQVENIDIYESDRGENGLGSTGTK